MNSDVQKQLAQLPKLSRKQLQELWVNLYERMPPPAMRRNLLIPLLAYRLQERAYGGLPPSTRAELRRIHRSIKDQPGDEISQLPRSVKAGTKIIRQWQGTRYEVTVTEGGFEYAGKEYRSLSWIARLITGTRWSGPLFFGLKSNSPEKEE